LRLRAISPVEALNALADPGGDDFHRLARGEPIGDLDPIIPRRS
jgi:hypothetical protein